MNHIVPTTPPIIQHPVVYAFPQTVLNVSKSQSRQAVVNGALQIVVGACSIIVNSILLAIGGMEVIGHGLWVGVFYIVTGSFMIAGGKNTKKCPMMASMVLCIIAASLFTPAHFAASLMWVLRMESSMGQFTYLEKVAFGSEMTLVILAVIEFALAVWGITVWCKTIGCCRSDSQNTGPVQLVQITNGQAVVLMQASGGQYMPYDPQPPEYSNNPVRVDQCCHKSGIPQPNDDPDATNPGPVETYQRFA